MWGRKGAGILCQMDFMPFPKYLLHGLYFFLGIPAAIGSDTCDHLRVGNKLQGSNWKKSIQ